MSNDVDLSEHRSASSSERNEIQPPNSPDWLKEALDGVRAGAVGLSARLSYLGMQDQLHLDVNTMKNELLTLPSPVAVELASRIDRMKVEGFQFLAAGPEAHAGIYSQSQRRIFFQPQGSMLSHAVGLNRNPIRTTLPILSHELAHHNGAVFYSIDDFTDQEKLIMLQRKLEAEATSMLTEAHIADVAGVNDIRPWNVSTEPRRLAIQNGELGQYIFDTHGAKYNFTAEADSAWAKANTNAFINTVYGGNMADPVSGKIRAFDLNAAYGRNIAYTRFDLQAQATLKNYDFERARWSNPQSDVRTTFDKLSRAGESDALSIGVRTAKGVGALGLLLAVSGAPEAFSKGLAPGVANLSRSGVDWLSYSAGTKAANLALVSFGELSLRMPRVGTAAVLLAGFASAYVGDSIVGRRLEALITAPGKSKDEVP